MENIIQQVVVETVKKIFEYYESTGIGTLDRMSEDLKLISDGMATQILSVFIDAADNTICDAKKERKADGVKIHERNVPRTLLTALGPFSYKRTYFDTDAGKTYILDDILGVSPYERVDAGVSARLVNTAAVHSYGRSAAIVAGDKVSRQSAWNKAMNTGEVAYVPKRADYTPEAIHIFADEDHVPLQDGTNAIVALVTVCAGKRSVCSGRNALIEPFHVQGYSMDKGKLWEYVYALCAEKFDMDSVSNVYIYGDGASWIKGGLDVFLDAVYVLDTFHYRKRMRSIFSGEVGAQLALTAHAAVMNNDEAAFRLIGKTLLASLMDSMPDGKVRERKAKSVNDSIWFILNNWEAIQNSRLHGLIGSCTEAMVSHVLSERLSRGPMGWSRKGLSKMVMIRVYVLNGGRVTPEDTLSWKHSNKKLRIVDKVEKYENIVKLQQDEVFNDVRNWRWFEVDSKISGKTTGTKVVLDALGKLRNVS